MEQHSRREIKWKKNDIKYEHKTIFLDRRLWYKHVSLRQPVLWLLSPPVPPSCKRAHARICHALAIRLAFVSFWSISLLSPSPHSKFYCWTIATRGDVCKSPSFPLHSIWFSSLNSAFLRQILQWAFCVFKQLNFSRFSQNLDKRL